MPDNAIKIWHQSFTVLENVSDYAVSLKQHLTKIARPGTELVMHGMHPNTYATVYPGKDIRYCSLQFLHSNQFFINGIKAQQEGYDAYAICTLPDPALRETRSVLNIPVLGYGETAMVLSSLFGRRFGILMFIEELIPLLEENVLRYGLSSKKAAIRYVGFGFNDVDFNNPQESIEKFIEAARRMIRDDGADVIIPGEAVLTMLLFSNGINRVDDVPVLDTLGSLIKMTETLVDLRRLSGIEASKKGYFQEQPPTERVLELLTFYGVNRFFDGK